MSVYTSDQYKILLDLSALMTAAIATIPYQKVVSAQLNVKLNRDNQFVFFTENIDDNKYNSVSAAGIEIVNSSYKKPNIKLSYNNSQTYTYDVLYNDYFKKQNISSPDSYAKHYVSGTLPSLTISIDDQPASINVLASVLDKHNQYELAHSNLNNLIYYYNKTDIDNQHFQINKNIQNIKITITNEFNKINTELTNTNNLLDLHINDLNCHSKVLSNYCKKEDYDKYIAQLSGSTSENTGSLTKHNNDETSHSFILHKLDSINDSLLSHKQDINAHQNLRNQITQHNKSTTAHQDIRNDIKSVNNNLTDHMNSPTAHQDIRDQINSSTGSLLNHNQDIRAHQDIRNLITQHDKSTTAHQDIRNNIDTINTNFNSHINSPAAHQAIRESVDDIRNTINSHIKSSTAHQDLRDQVAINNTNNTNAHNSMLNNISLNSTNITTLNNQFKNTHNINKLDQLNAHNLLLKRYNPQTSGCFLTINEDQDNQATHTIYDRVYLSLYNQDKNKKEDIQLLLNLSNQNNISIQSYSNVGDMPIMVKQYNNDKTLRHSITLLDTNRKNNSRIIIC